MLRKACSELYSKWAVFIPFMLIHLSPGRANQLAARIITEKKLVLHDGKCQFDRELTA